MSSVALIIYAMLVLVFLSGYAAAYTRPEIVWWVQLPAVVMPFISTALLLATPIVFLSRIRPILIIHFVLLLLVLLRFAPLIDGWRAAPHKPRMLTVLTFNAKEVYPDPDPMQSTFQLSESFRPDIVAIQGVPAYFRGGELARPTRPVGGFLSQQRYVTRAPDNFPRGHLFSPLLVRNAESESVPKLVEKRIFPFPGSDERAVTRAELDWGGIRFAVYNLHLHSFSHTPRRERSVRAHLRMWRETLTALRLDFQQRAEQTRFLRDILDAEHLPYIVCGDFNSTPHNWSYRQIARGLTDVQSAGRILPRATYHARYPVVRIDHILVSPHWRVHSAEVLPRSFSDHFPLLAVLSLRSED